MKTNKLLIATFLILIVSAASYYFFNIEKYQDENESDSAFNLVAKTTEVPLITIDTKNEDKPEDKIRIIVSTPNVKILSNPISSEFANSYILRFIDDEKSKYVSKLINDKTSTSSVQNIFNTLSITSSVVLNTPNIFVIRFDVNSLQRYKAKADTSINYIIFDIDKRKTLSFENIFTEPNTTEAIRSYLLLSSKDYGVSIDQITAALKLNHHTYINKEGLTVVVDIFDKDSGNISSKEIIIPLNIIEEYLNFDIKEYVLSEKEYIRMSEPE